MHEFIPWRYRSLALQLARHFRQAGMIIQAVTYLQQAGEQAGRIAANQEAIALCREALTLLQLLSDSPEKAQLELALQVTIGPALLANNGYSAPDVEATYARALELCYRLEDTTVILPILNGLWVYYLVRGNLMRSRELSEQLMALAESVPDSSAHLGAHFSVAYRYCFWVILKLPIYTLRRQSLYMMPLIIVSWPSDSAMIPV